MGKRAPKRNKNVVRRLEKQPEPTLKFGETDDDYGVAKGVRLTYEVREFNRSHPAGCPFCLYVGPTSSSMIKIGWFDMECKARAAADVIESWSGKRYSVSEEAGQRWWQSLCHMAAAL